MLEACWRKSVLKHAGEELCQKDAWEKLHYRCTLGTNNWKGLLLKCVTSLVSGGGQVTAGKVVL